MLRRLCSQKALSASSPFILKTHQQVSSVSPGPHVHLQDVPGEYKPNSCYGNSPICLLPQPAFQLATPQRGHTQDQDDHGSVTSDLMSSQAWKTDRRATWSENRLPAKFLWTKLSRLPSLTKGSGKQDAAEMVHMASPTLEGSKHKQTDEPPATAASARRRGHPLEDAAQDHHLPQTRLDRQTGQNPTQRRQLVVAVQSIQLCGGKHPFSTTFFSLNSVTPCQLI